MPDITVTNIILDKISFRVGLARRLFLLALTGILVLAFAPSPAAETSPLADIIAGVQDRYDKTRDFKARFIQEATLKTVNRTEREEGTVYFRNPQRMRWEYAIPKGKLLVINPEKAWLYLPEDRLAYVQDSEKMLQSGLAIKFLTGLGRLSEDFQISRQGPQKTDRAGNHLLVLVPKEAGGGIDKLTITVDKTTYSIIQLSMSDFAGNLTRIEFRNIVLNSRLPDRLFQFNIPAGVEVVPLP